MSGAGMDEGALRCTDPRGVLRGACSDCSCLSYLRPQEGVACSKCRHAPGRHANLDKNSSRQPAGSYSTPGPCTTSTYTTSYANVTAGRATGTSSAGLTRKPLYTQAQPAPYSSGHSAATTAFPQTHTSPHVCEAKGCYKTAYYDPMLGYFSYCSPECRDECLLPDYNTKLKADIANFEANPPTEYTQSSLSYGEIVRQPEIKKDSREPLGIIFARTDAKKIIVTGVLIKKLETELKNGQIKLHDNLYMICGRQVGISTTIKEVEDIAYPRTIISLMFDCTYAVNCDLRDFLKFAKSHNATHVFALWPAFMQDDYGLTLMDNKKSVVVYGTSEHSPARECGIKLYDEVVCYSSYAKKHLSEICKAKGKDRFLKDLYNATQNNSILILAIVRK